MRSCLHLTIVFAVLLAVPASAQRRLPNGMHSAVMRGVDLILRQEYAAADSTFQTLIGTFPQHPVGFLYRAAVMQSRSLDLGIPLDRARFDSLLTLARERIERLRSLSDQASWADYFDATADGYEAVARVDRGDWFGGIRVGMASASAFELVLRADSAFGDAYTGIGAYLYWRSRKTEFLHWLPFVSDDRKEGILDLMRGYRTGEYTRFAAVSSLISIFLDNGDHVSAEQWSRIGLTSYPTNRVFAWGRATALQRLERYADAVGAYDTLLTLILDGSSPNPYDQIVCRLNLVRCRLAAADTTSVSAHLDAILFYQRFPFTESYAERVKDKFAEARRLRADTKLPPTPAH